MQSTSSSLQSKTTAGTAGVHGGDHGQSGEDSPYSVSAVYGCECVRTDCHGGNPPRNDNDLITAPLQGSICRCGVVAAQQPSKLLGRVRIPSPAPAGEDGAGDLLFCLTWRLGKTRSARRWGKRLRGREYRGIAKRLRHGTLTPGTVVRIRLPLPPMGADMPVGSFPYVRTPRGIEVRGCAAVSLRPSADRCPHMQARVWLSGPRYPISVPVRFREPARKGK